MTQSQQWRHVESQFPEGSNLHPLHWKCGVLTPGLPGKSRESLDFKEKSVELEKKYQKLHILGENLGEAERTFSANSQKDLVGCVSPLPLLLLDTAQRRQWHPTPVLLPGKSHGRRSLVDCSPWGRKELDTTERFHFNFNSLQQIDDFLAIMNLSLGLLLEIMNSQVNILLSQGGFRMRSSWF